MKVFDTYADYESVKDGLEYPTVSYVKDSDAIYYMMQAELYEFVDLGLPSGLKWSAWNVGATKPEESGLYFAWGETQGYTGITDEKQFTWVDYTLCDGTSSNMLKYNITDGLTTLELVDDAAYATDSTCRIPTKDELVELKANTTSEWVANYNGTGVAGRIFNSKVNGNSIFTPAAGSCREGSNTNTLYGSAGCLWSSTRTSLATSEAWYCDFGSDSIDVYGMFGYCFQDHSIRPVK